MEERRGVGLVGYFQLRLAPVAPSIDGTAAARRRGLWVMPPLACGCAKPFPLFSHTAARQAVHAAAAAARLTVCRAPPPTAGPDNATYCSKQYPALCHTQTRTHICAHITGLYSLIRLELLRPCQQLKPFHFTNCA